MGKNGEENLNEQGSNQGNDRFTPITIDKKPYKVREPVTGLELYGLAAVGPEYDLYLEVRGRGDDILVPRTEKVFDLKPGDHLYTAQSSLNPGAAEQQLPSIDLDYLREKELEFSCEQVNGKLHLRLHNFELPEHYTFRKVDMLIVIPPGYPNAQLDMFYTSPAVKLQNGSWPLKADVHETFNGVSWQRWSRHLGTNWRVGTDGLKTFLRGIDKEIAKAA